MDGLDVTGLLAIGFCAGMLGGLVGVGGGVLFVPGLVFFLGLSQLEAQSTSLLAIVVIAALAAFAQGTYGNVHVEQGILIGVPAIAGVVAGTALQQRIPERAVAAIFAVLLVVSAAVLVF